MWPQHVMEHSSLRSYSCPPSHKRQKPWFGKNLAWVCLRWQFSLSLRTCFITNKPKGKERQGFLNHVIEGAHTLLCGHTQLRHIWFLLHIIKNLHQSIVRGRVPGDSGHNSKLITFRNNRETVNFTQ